MAATVLDIIRVLEELAPPGLAEEWDNAGLQVGKRDWPVSAAWVALDPSQEVVAAACREKIDLLICHHPLIFRPIRSIDLDTPLGRIIASALGSRLAIYSAHTNLDAVAGGISDLLALRLNLRNIHPLGKSAHGAPGMGRVGDLQEAMPLSEFALTVKEALKCPQVAVAGDPAQPVKRVASCPGSGSGLLEDFLASGAQVFVSGDLRYHHAREAEAAGRSLIDVGHFFSEHIVKESLCRRLREKLDERGIRISVRECTVEKDPFRIG